MDFKKTKWIEEKRRDWPQGSLERRLLLDYPGCKTLKEAFEQAVKDRQELKEFKEQLDEAGGQLGEATNKDPSGEK